MRKSSYREPDYTFGQLMLTLRTTIGLTQASVAERLIISRRAVAEWEAGQCYPKAEHLKAFIALALQQRVWAFGREVEEIRVPSTWTPPQPWIFCPCSIRRWDDTKRPNLY